MLLWKITYIILTAWHFNNLTLFNALCSLYIKQLVILSNSALLVFVFAGEADPEKASKKKKQPDIASTLDLFCVKENTV